jgi:hypothetical protein
MNTHETAVAAHEADRRPANRPRWGWRLDYDVDEAGYRHPFFRLSRLRQRDVLREHPEGAYRRGG